MRLVSSIYQDYYPFENLKGVEQCIASNDADDLKEGDVLVVWGGGDISPSLYNKPVSRYTGAGKELSRRDTIEWTMMQKALGLSLPIIGVCRGAQMLCALAGGHLIQHVDNHGGSHVVIGYNGEEFKTNSIHHQMMYPYDVPHEMLASIKEPLSKIHIEVDGVDVDMKEEPEFIYFPTVKGFAVQWHPEAMALDSKATQFVFAEIEKRL